MRYCCNVKLRIEANSAMMKYFLILLALPYLIQSGNQKCKTEIENRSQFRIRNRTLCIKEMICNTTYFFVQFSFNISGDPIKKIMVAVQNLPADLFDPPNRVYFSSSSSGEGNVSGVNDGDAKMQLEMSYKDPLSSIPKVPQVEIPFNCSNSIQQTVTDSYKDVDEVSTTTQSTLYQSSYAQTMELPVIGIVLPVILLLCAALILIYWIKLKRTKTNLNHILTSSETQKSKTLVEKDNNANIYPNYRLQANPTKIFLIFANDNEKHKQVIFNFANFLQADLGFDVNCELFQSLAISEDPVSWMDQNITNADKIIVIWSPKAIRLWNSKINENEFKHDHYDLFTPVLKHIWNDIFNERNIRKYYFGYFDYFLKESIPKEFGDSKIYNFHLMQEFHELYCQLREMEKYVPGGEMISEKVDSKSYFEEKVNKYGAALQTSIVTMVEFVKENPNWQQETDEIAPNTKNIFLDDNFVLKNVISISPPSPIPSSNTEKDQNENSDDKLISGYQNQSKPAFNFKIYESSLNTSKITDEVSHEFKTAKESISQSVKNNRHIKNFHQEKLEKNDLVFIIEEEAKTLKDAVVEDTDLTEQIDFPCMPSQMQQLTTVHSHESDTNYSKHRNTNACSSNQKFLPQALSGINHTISPPLISLSDKTSVEADLEQYVSNSIAIETQNEFYTQTEMSSVYSSDESGYVGCSSSLIFKNQGDFVKSNSNSNDCLKVDQLFCKDVQNTQDFMISKQNSNSPNIILVPVEVDSDPMKSLMDLNMSFPDI